MSESRFSLFALAAALGLGCAFAQAAPLSGPLIFQDDFSAGDAGDADEPDTLRWTQVDGADGGGTDAVNVGGGSLLVSGTVGGDHFIDSKPTATPYAGYSLPYGTASLGWQYETRFRLNGTASVSSLFLGGVNDNQLAFSDTFFVVDDGSDSTKFDLIVANTVVALELNRGQFYTVLAHHRHADGPGFADDDVDIYLDGLLIGTHDAIDDGRGEFIRVGKPGASVGDLEFDYVQVRVPEPGCLGAIALGGLLLVHRRRS